MMIGYARVSTAAQDHAGQVEELQAAGCVQVFAEATSGAPGRKRPQLVRALAALQPGDVLAVTRLNRLARSTRDALNTLAAVNAKGAGFKSLREAWADTTTAHGRLVLTLMAGLAEFDREMILERTGEGRAAAKARGVRLGRKPALSAEQAAFVVRSLNDKPPLTIDHLAALLGVSRSTIKRAGRADHPADLQLAAAPRRDPRQVDLEDLTGAPRP